MLYVFVDQEIEYMYGVTPTSIWSENVHFILSRLAGACNYLGYFTFPELIRINVHVAAIMFLVLGVPNTKRRKRRHFRAEPSRCPCRPASWKIRLSERRRRHFSFTIVSKFRVGKTYSRWWFLTLPDSCVSTCAGRASSCTGRICGCAGCWWRIVACGIGNR